jgi:cellulose synthase/poly-beta-1,6-N-acetylglucosamine synthase-like glycosyltransferase
MAGLKKKFNTDNLDFYPTVDVIVSAFNEEKVISKKIDSTITSNYPEDKFSIIIGSDNSTDKTNDLLSTYAKSSNQVSFVPFKTRQGKPSVVNELVKESRAEILILTDADTFFFPETIGELVKPFSDSKIGGVQANIRSLIDKDSEVLDQELTYNKLEFDTKGGESTKGTVIGAHGACYAIRRELYEPVPSNFSVDDFFIFMSVLAKGYKTVFASHALTEMQVSGSAKVQFKRKVRMGAGNFRNLLHFKNLLHPKKGFLAYAFFSHKVIRWIGPFLLIAILLSNMLLANYSSFWNYIWLCQMALYFLVAVDYFFLGKRMKINALRSIRHFILMNLAFLIGFIKFIFNRDSGTWQNTVSSE